MAKFKYWSVPRGGQKRWRGFSKVLQGPHDKSVGHKVKWWCQVQCRPNPRRLPRLGFRVIGDPGLHCTCLWSFARASPTAKLVLIGSSSAAQQHVPRASVEKIATWPVLSVLTASPAVQYCFWPAWTAPSLPCGQRRQARKELACPWQV